MITTIVVDGLYNHYKDKTTKWLVELVEDMIIISEPSSLRAILQLFMHNENVVVFRRTNITSKWVEVGAVAITDPEMINKLDIIVENYSH